VHETLEIEDALHAVRKNKLIQLNAAEVPTLCVQQITEDWLCEWDQLTEAGVEMHLLQLPRRITNNIKQVIGLFEDAMACNDEPLVENAR